MPNHHDLELEQDQSGLLLGIPVPATGSKSLIIPEPEMEISLASQILGEVPMEYSLTPYFPSWRSGAATIGSSTRAAIPSLQVDSNARLARLSAASRWTYLAKHDTLNFIFACGSVIAFALSILGYFNEAAKHIAFISYAYAADAVDAIHTSEFQYGPWFLAAFGVILVWSLLTITFAQATHKIDIARDTLKLVTGLIIGFFSGKVR